MSRGFHPRLPIISIKYLNNYVDKGVRISVPVLLLLFAPHPRIDAVATYTRIFLYTKIHPKIFPPAAGFFSVSTPFLNVSAHFEVPIFFDLQLKKSDHFRS